ncbi:MmgE/PrpD family protein [Chitinophaga silvisoli]|uniref:MmgE/PrpD family protein n=1 Tax=Chitinophaga silvisoli TaxID=2291814 RepID=A0A3E1NXN7_9BACT|nr:MmgE/PrpD family protein [Chitinophaga silvisoli]RFM32624.1 MmgE/PrpD family protein [Chitinophaga silvisoli]
MPALNMTERIARFSFFSAYEQLKPATIEQLKKHLLDAMGSMLYSMKAPTVEKLFRQIKFLQANGPLAVPVLGSTSVDRAAQLYTLLVRYPDYMDNYLGKHATCHPSDNIGGILAACQAINASGRDFFTAMAIGYQLECTLIDQMPLMAKGIDHTALLAMSLTAALGPLYGLTLEQAAHAIGITGSTFNTTVTTRASYTYEWKGYASSLVALGCTNTILLAKEGVTGPVSYFEGPMGFKDEFEMDPEFNCEAGDFSRIEHCILKSYNAEVHTQSAIEALLDLRCKHNIRAEDVKRIDATIFLTAYNIVGGGRYGDRKLVQTKEQADHSLPYLLAVAMLDGEVLPAQLLPERIRRPDVQALMEHVYVDTGLPLKAPRKVAEVLDPYTAPYPEKMPAKISIHLKDGKVIEEKKEDYKGFYTRPLDWEDVVNKFHLLGKDTTDGAMRNDLIAVIANLENEPVSRLTDLLAQIK